jgi:hypothetical protein
VNVFFLKVGRQLILVSIFFFRSSRENWAGRPETRHSDKNDDLSDEVFPAGKKSDFGY